MAAARARLYRAQEWPEGARFTRAKVVAAERELYEGHKNGRSARALRTTHECPQPARNTQATVKECPQRALYTIHSSGRSARVLLSPQQWPQATGALAARRLTRRQG